MNYEKDIEVNNEVKLNIDNQQMKLKISKKNVTKIMKMKFRKSQLLEFP